MHDRYLSLHATIAHIHFCTAILRSVAIDKLTVNQNMSEVSDLLIRTFRGILARAYVTNGYDLTSGD